MPIVDQIRACIAAHGVELPDDVTVRCYVGDTLRSVHVPGLLRASSGPGGTMGLTALRGGFPVLALGRRLLELLEAN